MKVTVLFTLLMGFNSFADGFGGRLGPHGLFGGRLGNQENWMAIVGDSGVTGAASSSTIEATAGNLWSLFYDFITDAREKAKPPDEPLTRVLYSQTEFRQASNPWDKLLLNLGAKFSLRLDVHENSFGYRVGRQLGIQPRDIVLVGQDGVQVSTIAAQFSRIFEMNTKTLPPLILVSYTANDLCDARVFEDNVEETARRFKDSLRKTWREAEPYLKPHPKSTAIYVLAPFDVVSVVTDSEVLKQTVKVEGQGDITCGRLRHGENHFTLASWFVLRTLNLMCPSVTKTHLEDHERLKRLREVQDAFETAWREQIDELNANHQGIKWRYEAGTRSLTFGAGDLGNDCFHPSAKGHAKIAGYLLQSMETAL